MIIISCHKLNLNENNYNNLTKDFYYIHLSLFMNKLLLLLLFTLLQVALSVENGVGLTPPLGWNSWNKYGCNIN
jgi:hypothetical protein